MAEVVAKSYDVFAPTVVFTDYRKCPSNVAAWYCRGVICLKASNHGRNLPSLLHEMAHHIGDMYGYAARHDETWLGIYVELMHNYLIMPRSASLPSLKKARVRCADPRKFTPERIKHLAKASADPREKELILCYKLQKQPTLLGSK